MSRLAARLAFLWFLLRSQKEPLVDFSQAQILDLELCQTRQGRSEKAER